MPTLRRSVHKLRSSTLLTVLLEYRNRYRESDLDGFIKAYRECRRASNLVAVFQWLRFFLRPKETILFFPQKPRRGSVEYKLCVMLGCSMTNNLGRQYDVAFKRHNITYSESASLNAIPISKRPAINEYSVDISKRHVCEAFSSVFGYHLDVAATHYHGAIVEKANENATHDGRVLQGPINPRDVREACVYQRLIDNSLEDGKTVLDYRVPIYGGRIPLVYLKYRPIEERFSNENTRVELAEPSAVFSHTELEKLAQFSHKLGIDYGEVDVLRDREGRIYVVDANNTPWGPPNGLPGAAARLALERLATAFEQLIEKHQNRTA